MSCALRCKACSIIAAPNTMRLARAGEIRIPLCWGREHRSEKKNGLVVAGMFRAGQGHRGVAAIAAVLRASRAQPGAMAAGGTLPPPGNVLRWRRSRSGRDRVRAGRCIDRGSIRSSRGAAPSPPLGSLRITAARLVTLSALRSGSGRRLLRVARRRSP